MRRSVVFTFASLALPTLALAAFEHPSDIVRSLQTATRPMDISYEIHGEMPDAPAYMTMWLKGTGKNNLLHLDRPDADVRMTLDIVAPKTKVRMKAQIRAKDGDTFLHIDKVEGTYDDELVKIAAQLEGPKWFKFPSLAASMAEIGTHEEVARQMMLDLVDAVLVLDKQGPNYYELTLTKDMSGLIALAQKWQPEADPTYVVADAKSILENSSLSITVEASGDEARIVRFNGSMTEPTMHASISGKGVISARWTPFSVVAPSDAVDIQDLAQSLMNFPGPTVFPDNVPVWTEDESDNWEEWQPPVNDEGGCWSSDPLVRVSAQRRGECGSMRESPRTINDRVRSRSSSSSSTRSVGY